MGKKRKRSRPAKISRKAKSKPQQVVQRGPLRASQWGSVVLLENLSSPEQQVQIEEHLATKHPEMCRKIDDCVQRMCAVVRSVDPLKLLLRAYWHLVHTHLGEGPEESKVEHKHLVARRLLDYGQSLITAIGTDNSQEVTDEQFEELKGAADDLYTLLNPHYFITRTALAKKQPDYDEKRDEFIVLAQLHYCGVRGDRYLSHDVPHLNDLLLPQSNIIAAVYGITAEKLLDGFERLLRSVSNGLTEAFRDMDRFREETLPALAENDSPSKVDSDEIELPASIDREKWISERDNIVGRLFGVDLFDVGHVTSWPIELISDLSLRPGEDFEFAGTGDYSAWPTRLSLTWFRPFLAINGASYCFDVYGLTDNFYRAVQRALLHRRPDLADEWRINQQQITESLPFKMLGEILKGATIYRPVYYRARTGATQVKDWAECDGILIYDKHLFVVEVRAGAYVHSPPEHDIDAHMASLANILLKPITQANRLIDELESNTSLQLCNAEHKPIATINRADFEEVTACCVTLDQLEYLASHIEDLSHLSPEVNKRAVWCVSIDDLRVYHDVFDNPLVFLDFLSERKRAQFSEPLNMIDELDHLGAYLHHNRYVTRGEKIATAPMSSVTFAAGYRDELDQYYSKLWHGQRAKPPVQEMPRRIRQIVDTLAHSKRTGRAAAASALLCLGGDARTELAEFVDKTLQTQSASGRRRPLSMFGNVCLTVFCDQKPLLLTAFEDAIDHSLAVMSIEGEPTRTLLQLTFSEFGLLEDVRWKSLTLDDLQTADTTKIEKLCNMLRETRRTKQITTSPTTGTQIRS